MLVLCISNWMPTLKNKLRTSMWAFSLGMWKISSILLHNLDFFSGQCGCKEGITGHGQLLRDVASSNNSFNLSLIELQTWARKTCLGFFSMRKVPEFLFIESRVAPGVRVWHGSHHLGSRTRCGFLLLIHITQHHIPTELSYWQEKSCSASRAE